MKKSEIYIEKLRLPFGEYVQCDICKQDWTVFIAFHLFGHEFVMCPDCFEKFREKVRKIPKWQ